MIFFKLSYHKRDKRKFIFVYLHLMFFVKILSTAGMSAFSSLQRDCYIEALFTFPQNLFNQSNIIFTWKSVYLNINYFITVIYIDCEIKNKNVSGLLWCPLHS